MGTGRYCIERNANDGIRHEQRHCKSIPELGVHMENGINVDPKHFVEEFAVAGVPVNGKPVPPFRNLHVRVRGQVVADGLDQPLDWQRAGYDNTQVAKESK